MPLFYQQDINDNSRLAVWAISEPESFFLQLVPQHRAVTHPHKRLQHLAGRFLLRTLFTDFPLDLIAIADTHRPFLENEQYHFSISHAGDYAAAIVSRYDRVGIDVEEIKPRVMKVKDRFISDEEAQLLNHAPTEFAVGETLIWSVKESLFKWHAAGEVDFKEDMEVRALPDWSPKEQTTEGYPCRFRNEDLQYHCRRFESLWLSWIRTPVNG